MVDYKQFNITYYRRNQHSGIWERKIEPRFSFPDAYSFADCIKNKPESHRLVSIEAIY